MSTLSPQKIKENVASVNLITAESYDVTKIKQACYEARVSNDFFEIEKNNAVRKNIDDNDFYILRPNNQVVCVTKEYFNIPKNIIARVALNGDYFALGIAPVNTYADPGFQGKLGIVLSNTSRNYIKLKPNDSLAKIEFSTLTDECEKGYVGQHGGEVKTWPFRGDLIVSDEEFNTLKIKKNSNDEIKKIYGDTLAKTIADVRYTKIGIIISTFISTALPLLLVWGIYQKWNPTSPVLSALIGLVTGILVNVICNRFFQK